MAKQECQPAAQITLERAAQYRTSRGSECPFCGSPRIEDGCVWSEHGVAYREVDCDACGEAWVEEFSLARLLTVDLKEIVDLRRLKEPERTQARATGGRCWDCGRTHPVAGCDCRSCEAARRRED